jgi:hypothetical protein
LGHGAEEEANVEGVKHFFDELIALFGVLPFPMLVGGMQFRLEPWSENGGDSTMEWCTAFLESGVVPQLAGPADKLDGMVVAGLKRY